MNTLGILRAARALIADPERWTQGAYARNETGVSVASNSSDACKFCSLGAFQKIDGETRAYLAAPHALLMAFYDLYGSVECRDAFRIPYFNDGLSHAQVLAAWDLAISRLENEQ